MHTRWQQRAACRPVDTDIFFPDDPNDEPKVAAWCLAKCPVVRECREHALAAEAHPSRCFGVAGGMTASERADHLSAHTYEKRDLVGDLLESYAKCSSREAAIRLEQDHGVTLSYRTVLRRRLTATGDAA